MEITVDPVDGGRAVVRPAGRLDLVSAASFRGTVKQCVNDGHSVVVVDLTGVTFIDSTGLGALVGGLKQARQAGGDLRICSANEQVTTVLELTQLQRVLRVHPDVEAAFGAG